MEIKFSKIFDVKSPLGTNQVKQTGFNNIGVDLYFPNPTIEFFKAIIKANEKIVDKNPVIVYEDVDSNTIKMVHIVHKDSCGSCHPLLTFENGKYLIHKNLQIPTGIQFLIPRGYTIEICPKSSNFHNNYNVILGYIDENYTFGCGAQIIRLSEYEPTICLEPNQKFCQIILRKSEFIDELQEVNPEDWDNNIDVYDRQKSRSGGFGSTGKF